MLDGGTVSGNGSFHSLTGSGTIAPGNSIGTLTVATANIGAGSVYEVELNAAGASDKLMVTGAATIAGGASVLAIPEAGGYGTAATKYTILTANGGITGGFGGVSSATPYFTAVLSADANNVYLSLTPQLSASGDGFASLSTAMLDDSRYLRDAVLDRLQSGRDAPGTVAPTGFAGDPTLPDGSSGSGVWARTYGGVTHLNANGSAPSIDLATGGLAIGGDASAGAAHLGALFSTGVSGFSVPARDLTGSSANVSGGLYGGADWNNFYLSFGTTFTHHNVASTRTVALGGGGSTYHAAFTALTAQGFGEAGYEIDIGATSVTPFAGLAAVGNWTSGFTETGPAGVVTASPGFVQALISTLGVRLEHQFVLGDDMLVTLSGSAGWRHALGGTATTSNSLGGFAFQATGAPLAADALALTAGADLDISESLALRADYSALIAPSSASHALTATITGKF
jgi:outer membrane autotransporter protein